MKTPEQWMDKWLTTHGLSFEQMIEQMIEQAQKEAYDEAEREMYLNMQYYMEYCQAIKYVTPQEWIEEHKHF